MDHAAVPSAGQRLLILQRDGHWGNTQDNALALAFGKLARRLPDEEQPPVRPVRLPDGTVREFAATNDVSWSTAPGGGGGVEIRNDGPGAHRASVRRRSRGARTWLPARAWPSGASGWT